MTDYTGCWIPTLSSVRAAKQHRMATGTMQYQKPVENAWFNQDLFSDHLTQHQTATCMVGDARCLGCTRIGISLGPAGGGVGEGGVTSTSVSSTFVQSEVSETRTARKQHDSQPGTQQLYLRCSPWCCCHCCLLSHQATAAAHQTARWTQYWGHQSTPHTAQHWTGFQQPPLGTDHQGRQQHP